MCTLRMMVFHFFPDRMSKQETENFDVAIFATIN